MPLNLLSIDVGNTRTAIGAFVDDELVDERVFGNSDGPQLLREIVEAFQPVKHREGAGVVMGSVNPRISDTLESSLSSILEQKVYRVERDMPIPIGRRLDPEAIVGEDRLLNAAAAYDTLKQACVIIDAGTAVKIDFVDGAGTFHGGAIAPGAQLMLDSLHQRAALLPEVEFDKPAELIGHNTREAMLTGCFFGIRGMVRELVERYAEVAGAYPMVIATGGNSDLLFRDFELVERIVPDLTLKGLAVTVRTALQPPPEAGDPTS